MPRPARCLLLSLLLLTSPSPQPPGAPPAEFEIWPGALPAGSVEYGAEQKAELAARNTSERIAFVERPTLTPFLADPEDGNGCAVIICPGGGYNILAWQKEGVVEQQDKHWVLLRPQVLEELAAPIRHSLNYHMGMSLAPLDRRRASLAQASLEIAAGHPRWIGRSFAVEEELIIGRQPPSTLLLPSELVSPQHCRVFRAATGGRFWIEDMESLNGCELNDRPVKLNVLKDGDQIRVGGFTLTFRSSR